MIYIWSYDDGKNKINIDYDERLQGIYLYIAPDTDIMIATDVQKEIASHEHSIVNNNLFYIINQNLNTLKRKWEEEGWIYKSPIMYTTHLLMGKDQEM